MVLNGTAHLCVILTSDYRGQLWKGHQKLFFTTKLILINRFIIVRTYLLFSKFIFCSMKPRFLLYIDWSGIINCNTFSVVPSIIIGNAKNTVPLNCAFLFSFNIEVITEKTFNFLLKFYEIKLDKYL